jgi:hypothetical protein
MIDPRVFAVYRHLVRLDSLEQDELEIILAAQAAEILLKHEAAEAAAVTRYHLPGAANLVVPIGMQVICKYSRWLARWVIFDYGPIPLPTTN